MKSRRNDIHAGRALRPTLKLDDDHALRLTLAEGATDALAVAAMRYFDDNMKAEPGMVAELPSFIEQARRIDPSFFVSPDALYHILEERDRRRRQTILGGISDSEIEGLMRVPLYPYQLEGIRFAFAAGRSLIADGIASGNTATAIGAAELMYSRGLATSVLIVCPTSLKYLWKNEIERLTGRPATVIEGTHQWRRDLYRDKVLYKIVSYHTLANDVRAVGGTDSDCVIFDEIQRISGWNQQIAKALRHVEAEYCIALSGNGTASLPEELFDGCRVLVRSANDIARRLPDRLDTVLPVPMTREQQEIHGHALGEATHLLEAWRKCHFLSEKGRRRLLEAMNRMQCAAGSTYLLDRNNRHDTKIGEALEIIRANAGIPTVVFSRWSRMTGLLAEELTRADIPFEYISGRTPERRKTDTRAADKDCNVVLCTDAASAELPRTGAQLVIHLDLPGSADIAEERLSRACRHGIKGKIRIISMVSVGSVEEKMQRAMRAGAETGIPCAGDMPVTIDDAGLDLIASTFAAPDGDAEAVPGDNYIIRNPETGLTEIRIPVESREQTADILNNLLKIFGTPKR